MEERIIYSETSVERRPDISFFLSLFFPGLGQVYNGEIFRGIAYLFGLNLLLIIVPFYVIKTGANNYLNFFLFFMSCYGFFRVVSPAEAYIFVKMKKGVILTKFNSPYFYSIFGFLSISSTILSIALVSSVFTIIKVKSDRMQPALFRDEYILININRSEKLLKGDAVSYGIGGKEKIARIMALSGENVRYRKNLFYVNNIQLSLGIFSDNEISKMGVALSDNIFYEINDRRAYPVRTPLKKIKINKSIVVDKDKLMVVFDNRINDVVYEIINKKDVYGRVEGVILSNRFSRLFMFPFVKKN